MHSQGVHTGPLLLAEERTRKMPPAAVVAADPAGGDRAAAGQQPQGGGFLSKVVRMLFMWSVRSNQACAGRVPAPVLGRCHRLAASAALLARSRLPLAPASRPSYLLPPPPPPAGT